jgi:hypothetical protein
MNHAKSYSADIEVHEQTLTQREMGFLTGAFEAWANNTMTEAEFRGAMELLLAEAADPDR